MPRKKIPSAAAKEIGGKDFKARGKKATQAHEESELKLGDRDGFKCPAIVRRKPRALRKWNELIDLYTDPQYNFNLVTGSDSDMLARYCIAYDEYFDLQERREKIDKIKVKTQLFIGEGPEIAAMIEERFKLNALLRIDNLLMKKSDFLLKMEDRMFLNPYSKARYGGAPQKEKDSKLKEMGFGDI